jgi:hypothetical protein
LVRNKNGGVKETEKPRATRGRIDVVEQEQAKRAITG